MAAPAAPAERIGTSMSALPDSALAAIFSKCSMRERLQCLSLVCKHWHELCGTPSLVRKVAVTTVSDADTLQRMRSLLLWLQHVDPVRELRHAAHVRELSLVIGDMGEGAAEVLQLVAAAAACCGPQLRQLEILLTGQQQPRLVVSSWLCSLTGLTSLHLRALSVHTAVSLTGLTALEQLAISAVSAEHPTTPWLPPNLTALIWATGRLPEQATSLQRLQHVCLVHPRAAALAGSLDVMTRLAPSLSSLALDGSLAAVPPELAALGGRLQQLKLVSKLPSVVVEVGSISALTSLTALFLRASTAVGPAPGLQQLSRLQQLYISNGDADATGPAQATHPAPPGQPVLRSLPPGAWLGGLTRLALSYDVLFGSLDVLPAATRLQELTILRLQCMPAAPPPGEPQPRWDAFRSWLCCHPPLRQLTLVCLAAIPVELLELVLALAERRPGLVIECRRTLEGVWF